MLNNELHQAQNEAMRNAERLRGAIESSLNAFYLLESVRDAQGAIIDFVVVEVNRIGAQRFHLSREQMIGHSLSKTVPSNKIAEEMISTYHQVISTGQAVTQERLTDLGYEWRWFRQQIVKVGDGVAITSSDITEQKALEDDRTAEHLRLELALEGGGLGTWEYNLRTNIVSNDQRAIPILGLRADELEANPIALQDRIHPDDRSRLEAALLAYMRGETKNFEVEIRTNPSTGEPRWFLCRGRAIECDSQGDLVRIAGTYMDITERVLVEAQLRASEQRYQTLSTISPVGIYRANRHGFFTYVNPRWCMIVGISAEAGLGMGWQRYIHPEDYMLVRNFWNKTINNQQESQIEFRYLRPDGRICWVIAQVVAETDPNGVPIGYVGTQIDITRRMIIEERLRQQSALLEEANTNLAKAARLKDQFLANMSHELRTPLTGIIGFSEALSQGLYGDLVEAQQRAVQHIFDNGQHLLRLINDILDLARIGSGQVDLKLGPVFVDDACCEIIDLLSALFQGKKQQFTYTPPEAGLSIEADILRLRQILINLLANASKFTPEGGKLGLEVHYELWRKEVHFCIWDHGIGIAPNQQYMLFQPFVQLDNRLARDQPGTGLGLALVRQLVTLHGGRIEVESRLGEGSRFSVILPQHTPHALIEAIPTHVEEASRASITEPNRTIHILLAEDDPSVADLLLEYLAYQGYSTSYVAKGNEVVENLHTLRPHLLLIDIQMPGMSGLDVIARLRSDPDPEIAQIPIIAITALAMAGDRERCLAAGADDYLSKPVRLENLGSTLRRVLHTTQD
ncbi:PAS domain-containing hybrid sensor histidine kinase/response regulator [Candidatus Oscillochloris fontis]|uniref:hybrid sensor histidine kinase/response regulator n=1 Tax=Candidatus Oscillochloris fontis TaxID=2496868 RepID=UPI00101C0B1E|nr:PAS domain-containing hybrid sensor histidine kinase/response regulator [Candidatus Oscillochloris fontis]